MADRLAGKTALITGASAGMGRATALRFAREGANVVLVGRSRERLDQAAAEIGEQALPVVADVRRAPELEAAFNAGLQRWGEIQIVFNNAGGVVFDSSDEDLARPYLVHELSEALFDEYIALNLKSAWLGMKYGIPCLQQAGGGSIISTSSLGAEIGLPGTGAYAAAKNGIHALTRTAAAETAAQNIRVNCIVPGAIVSRFGLRSEAEQTNENLQARRDHSALVSPLARAGEAEDIAALALFLASDESGFITGQSIPVDGGWLAIDARLAAHVPPAAQQPPN